MEKKTMEMMDMTQSIENLKLLGAIRNNNYAPLGEADTAEAVKLNQNAQKPTLYALDGYSALFPRVEFFGSNGRLCASMRAGWDFENVSVI